MNSARKLLLVIGLMAFIPVVAQADDASCKARDAVWSKVLERLDINKNKNIEPEELAVRLQQLAQHTDADHNGVVSPDELHAVVRQVRQVARKDVRTALQNARPRADRHVNVAKLEAGIHQALAQADADHNGELTRAEAHHAVDQALHQVRQRVAQRENQVRADVAGLAKQLADRHPEEKIAAAAIGRLDANHNGKLEQQELQARAQKAFAAVDVDHDGAISDAELRQAVVKAAELARRQIEERVAKFVKQVAAR